MGSPQSKRISCSQRHRSRHSTPLLQFRKKALELNKSVSADEWWKSVDLSAKARKKRQRELDKLKKRRHQKEIEKLQREEEKAILAKKRARAESQDWEKKEEEFLVNQCRLRSQIRLQEGRPKPIDILLAKILEDFDHIDILDKPAYMVFKGLTVRETEQLRDEIEMHFNWDKIHVDFWEALLIVANWELAEVRKRDTFGYVQEIGLHSSIEGNVKSLLERKSLNELEIIQRDIESQMCSGAAKVVEFWEATLKHIEVYKAKARLNEIHTNLRKRHAQLVESGYGVFLSLRLLQGNNEKAIDDPKNEPQALEHQIVDDGSELEAVKAMGAIGEDDLILGSDAEVDLNLQWHGKYRPRKPKYFNRIHTGHVWNKYNQTHYDHDNLPPKMVHGYKFNIFYPELLDKSKAPNYMIEKDGSNENTCIIRFHAGPPYEDIAFRIINKEWEYSPKKGFNCTFEPGVLRLYFNFKRYRYSK